MVHIDYSEEMNRMNALWKKMVTRTNEIIKLMQIVDPEKYDIGEGIVDVTCDRTASNIIVKFFRGSETGYLEFPIIYFSLLADELLKELKLKK